MTGSLVRLESPFASVVERAAAGDRAAFAALVDAYHADMSRVAFVVCGDRDMAADAVQAAWQVAWDRLHTVRDPDRVRSWLVAVAANEARQAARHERRLTLVDLEDGRVRDLDGDATDSVTRIDLGRALAHLDPRDRQLLALRYLVGLDSTEVAAQVGMSPSGVRGHLSRVVARLRRELGDD